MDEATQTTTTTKETEEKVVTNPDGGETEISTERTEETEKTTE